MKPLKMIRKLTNLQVRSLEDLFSKAGIIQKREINNAYTIKTPDPQNALDIFQGEWASRFPSPYDQLQAGRALLFEDVRLQWALDYLGGLQGKTVLELGPLEGGHTYMLEQNGAEHILAVEANTRAYLKCLITKEILRLQRAQFLCGDFRLYLQNANCPTFDFIVASGVLYHMINPVELISLLAEHCEGSLYLWTHYYDEDFVRKNHLHQKFPKVIESEFKGFKHHLYLQLYKRAVNWSGFCGGSAPYSHWLNREELLACLVHFGFTDIQINFDQRDHPNGPCFSLLAKQQAGH